MATTTTKNKSTKKPAKTTKKSAASKISTDAKSTAKAEPADSNSKITSANSSVASSESKSTLKDLVKKSRVSDVFKKLRQWNLAMALLHAAQGIAVAVLSKDALFPVTSSYLSADTLSSTDAQPVLVTATRQLMDVNLGYVVAAYFFMSAIAHLIIATVYKERYERNLKKGMNKARWYEYGISASTMMIAIAMLSGVADLSTLVLIFGTTLVMNLCGLVMEVHNQTTEKTNWISYVVGSISGILPWIVIGLYLWGANMYGEGRIPNFVYYIYISLFVFFCSFAVNMWLQYKGKGRWSDYLYGEKAYMVLSLVAKSALAWQVFVGTLRP